ncbi:MAG: hypothetical protein AAFX06_03600 [Planctomycetota bacterium]
MNHDDQANPFSSPRSEVLAEGGAISVDFVPIMRHWDRLRLFYNAVLFTEVIGVAVFVRPDVLFDIGFLPITCIGAIVANVCFMTGPAIEAYGTYYRLWHPLMTCLLFFAGLGVSMMLAFGTVLGL